MKIQFILLLLLIPTPFVFGQVGDQNGIPPTNSFQVIKNATGGNVTAQAYNDEVTFIGQSGISIITDFLTNTITFAYAGMGGGGDCSTVGKWLDSFNYTSYNFDCDTAGGNFTDSTTASNLSPGTGIFSSKVGNDLEFKSLDDGTGITITNNATTVIISNSLPEATTGSNLGIGENIFSGEVGNDLQFKTILAGDGMFIDSNSTNLILNSTGSGETNTASNVGTGDGWFKQKTGVDLEFKTIITQDGITSTPNTNDITLGIGTISKSKISNTGTFGWSEISKSGSSIHDIGNVTSVGCASGQILKVNATGYFVCSSDDTGGGESTTASNVGTGEGSVFKQETGNDLEFKTLKQDTGITITNNTSDVTITNSLPEATTASNLGIGENVFSGEVGNDLQFKTLIAGDGMFIDSNSTNLILNSTGSGGALDDILLEGAEISNSRSNINFNDTVTINLNVQDDAGLDSGNVTASIIAGSVGNTELGTGIDVSQFADGSVSDTEFQRINSVTSNVQDQLDAKYSATNRQSSIVTSEISNDQVTYPKIQNVVNDDRFLGRISGANGDIEELTGTQATSLLDVFTDSLKGLTPSSGGGTTNFLRADGTWAVPPSGGGALDDILLEGAEISNSRSNLNFNDTPAINFNVQDDVGLDSGNVTATIVSGSIGNTELGTGIDVSQFGDGSVSDTEFQRINSVTSNVQDQLNAKQTTTLSDGNILVGSAGNLATSVNPTGAVDISNTGVFSIPNIHSIGNVTSVGCWVNAILKVNSTGQFACADDDISLGGVDSINGDISSGQTLLGTTNKITIDHDMAGSHTFNVGSKVSQLDTAQTYDDGIKLTFNPSTTNAGVNIGAVDTAPSSPIEGDIFVEGDADKIWTYLGTNWINLVGTSHPKSHSFTCGSAQPQVTNTPPKSTIDGTNMDYVVCDFDATTSETLIWSFEIPSNIEASADITATIHFQVATGTAGVCWDVSFLDLSSGGSVDGTFTSVKGACDSSTGTNTVEETTITFSSAEHSIDANDLVFVKLSRDVADAGDTNANDARMITMELEWG